jgi:hypothetical protein
MRTLAMSAAGICLLAMSAGINPVSAAGATEAKAPIVLAQAQPKKDETVKQKVKRVWRNWTGYKFAVACPALIPLSHSTCTETGKNRDVARSKCQSANPICSVNDVR